MRHTATATTRGGFQDSGGKQVRSYGRSERGWAAITLRAAGNWAERLADHAPLRAPRAQREIDAGELQQVRGPVKCARTAGRHVRDGRPWLQEHPGAIELSGGITGGQEPVVADLHEAARQDVEEKAPNELVRRESNTVAAFGGEVNALGTDVLQALIGDSDAVRVAAEIAEDLLRPAEGTLRIDDPFGAIELVDELLKRNGINEGVCGATELELAVSIRLRKGSEELAAEQAGEYLDGEQIAAARGDPVSAIGGETAARDDAVHVRVEVELPGPGVQDGGDAEVRSKSRWVAAECQQGLRGCPKEQREDPTTIALYERPERSGQREDHVEVVRRQEPGEALLNPLRLAQALALGTVAVTTGIVGGTLVPTGVAHVEVTAEGGRPTQLDRAHRGALIFVDRVSVAIRLAVGAKDVGDFQGRAINCRATRRAGRVHRRYSGSGGRSSVSRGLRVCPIWRVLMCV